VATRVDVAWEDLVHVVHVQMAGGCRMREIHAQIFELRVGARVEVDGGSSFCF
jgi:hypothetical protein